MIDQLEIPDFLRRSHDEPRERATYIPRARKPEAWARPKPPRGWPKGMPVPKTIEPATLALAREIDRAQKEKAKARFAALKARRA